MILNNSLSLMDENYFNFQLEMADLQTYHNVYSSALEITNESENVFVKIKNAIVNFFKKIINFIRNIFKKETKETANKNKENKDAANTVNNKKAELKFPINVSGGDNAIYDIDPKDFELTEVDNAISDLQTFKDIVNNAESRTKEQIMHFVKGFAEGIDVTGPNFSTELNTLRKVFEDNMGELEQLLKDKANAHPIKLSPGGKISSQQELDKIISLSKDNKFEKLISDYERTINIVEKLSSDIEKKVQKLNIDDKEIIKIFNNTFSLTSVVVNNFIKITNIQKNMVKRNVDTINSVLNQVNK